MKIQTLFSALLLSSVAMAQAPALKPFVMKSPNEFRINCISGNGKWACGVYADYSDERYGFLWNLESGEIEMLNPSIPSVAYQVSDNGIVVGHYTDNTYKSNGASLVMAGYWANHKWNRLEMPSDGVVGSRALSVSPDGRYVSGNVVEGGLYTGYIWKDGKIYKELINTTASIPFAINPDGQSAAGWMEFDQERKCCIWEAGGNDVTFLSEWLSPWSYGRKYSHDGSKLLYYGGYNNFGTDTDENWGVYGIYDLATKQKTGIFPPVKNDERGIDFFDISDRGTVVGCLGNDEIAFLMQDGKSYYAEDYLKERGVDLAEEHVLKTEDSDYFQMYRAGTVTADDNIMSFLYYNDDKAEDGQYDSSIQSMVVKFNQPTTGLVPVSVKASQLSGLNSALVSWKPNVAAEGISGYNIYRDGNKINSELVVSEEYIDATASLGTHSYAVTAVYGSDESQKSEACSLEIATKATPAPTAVFAQQRGYNNAYLQWNTPQTNFASLAYSDPDNVSLEGFGLRETGVSMETAVRFDATKTSAYKGQKITSVGFYPLSEQGSWKVNLYTYDATGKLQQIYSQPVTQKLNYGERNEVKLNTPQDLPAGELLVAIEVNVTEASQNILGLDNTRQTKQYSDLVRGTDENGNLEPDFYSIGEVFEETGYLYPASWPIDATIAPADADMSKDEVNHYEVYADGKQVASSETKNYTLANLTNGAHTMGVKAVYKNGIESPLAETTLNIKTDDSKFIGVDSVGVEHKSNTTVTAFWNSPKIVDKVHVQYCDETDISEHAVAAPSDNNYCMMVSALYPSKTFRGRNGYKITGARFIPLTNASYTVMLYENGEQLNEIEVSDFTIGKWNEVKFDEPITLSDKNSYQLVIDCYDCAPNEPVMAIDNTSSVEGYSDLYSINDGESWNPLSSAAVYSNWMIGLSIESPESYYLPVKGYDVTIDGTKQNAELLTQNTLDHTFAAEDAKQHTIQVDVYYNVQPQKSVKGAVNTFFIGTAGITDNAIATISLTKGDNQLTVNGSNVSSVALVAANGATVAQAAGNTVSLNGVTAGVYVVKAVVDGESVVKKIQIK